MKKLLSLALAGIMLISMVACTNENEDTSSKLNSSIALSQTVKNRDGNEYDIPETVNTIISTAASNTEILVGLGLSDKIIATDTYSADVEGLKEDNVLLDMQNLDMEKIIEINPDVLFVNEINFYGDDTKYDLLKSSGIEMIVISSADSLQDIMDDITLMSQYTKTEDKGNELVSNIEDTINVLKEKKFADTPKVYFEMGAAPYLYTTGAETYLNEIITLCGGINIYADQNGWLSNSDESVIAGNPDIIISNVAYEGYSYTEINDRDGWDVINAVKNDNVYFADANATSRASQNIVLGIKAIANIIHPDTFE